MSFREDFSSQLGAWLELDMSQFELGSPSQVREDIDALSEFLAELNETSMAALEAIVGEYIDPTALTDEDGRAVELPGGALWSLAAASPYTLASFSEGIEAPYVAAIEANPGEALA